MVTFYSCFTFFAVVVMIYKFIIIVSLYKTFTLIAVKLFQRIVAAALCFE